MSPLTPLISRLPEDDVLRISIGIPPVAAAAVHERPGECPLRARVTLTHRTRPSERSLPDHQLNNPQLVVEAQSGCGVSVRVVECFVLLVSPESDNLRVVLVATRNPLNLGAAARAMSNFGFLRLRVVNPYALAFREARSAVGASAVLKHAEECQSVADAVADCALVVGTTTLRNRERHHPLHRLEYGARRIRKGLGSKPIALLFGSEKVGLSNEDLSHCHWLMHIPTREKHPSMNLGQAVAVCLYEIVRNVKVPVPAERGAPAAAADLERITMGLLESLRATGYLSSAASLSTEAKIRRFVRRLRLEARDAELLLGMLRQILWKVRSSDG
jgi:TrmH family RNA methyltransferase